MSTVISRATVSFFGDKHGRLVLWQTPNLPLIGWIICLVVARMAPVGALKSGLNGISTAFLFVWAYLEMTQGVSWFRRLFGGVVMVVVLAGFFLH